MKLEEILAKFSKEIALFFELELPPYHSSETKAKGNIWISTHHPAIETASGVIITDKGLMYEDTKIETLVIEPNSGGQYEIAVRWKGRDETDISGKIKYCGYVVSPSHGLIGMSLDH